MSAPSLAPYLNRICNLRCRLTHAQQRIRELEALLASSGTKIPAAITQVPGADHDCFRD